MPFAERLSLFLRGIRLRGIDLSLTLVPLAYLMPGTLRSKGRKPLFLGERGKAKACCARYPEAGRPVGAWDLIRAAQVRSFKRTHPQLHDNEQSSCENDQLFCPLGLKTPCATLVILSYICTD